MDGARWVSLAAIIEGGGKIAWGKPDCFQMVRGRKSHQGGISL